MISWVAYLSIGILIGFAAGFYFSHLNGSEKKKREELESKLNSAQNEITHYKQNVTDHFVKTSSLINNMTDSYRAIYNHMSDGAKTLCSQSLIDSPASKYQLDIPTAKLIETENDLPSKTGAEAQNQETSDAENETPIESINNAVEESTEETVTSIETVSTDTSSHETLSDDNNNTEDNIENNKANEPVLYEKNKEQGSQIVH